MQIYSYETCSYARVVIFWRKTILSVWNCSCIAATIELTVHLFVSRSGFRCPLSVYCGYQLSVYFRCQLSVYRRFSKQTKCCGTACSLIMSSIFATIESFFVHHWMFICMASPAHNLSFSWTTIKISAGRKNMGNDTKRSPPNIYYSMFTCTQITLMPNIYTSVEAYLTY